MGFLDNSGDIILDSFKIAKFAFGDDEINYNNYNKDHDSGSAYYDLDILQTPVLEAFTNNTSLMRSKLITISRTNLLYLPVLKLNTLTNENARHSTLNTFLITVDENTENSDETGGIYEASSGILKGYNAIAGSEHIRLDQGLDTSAIPPAITIDADLNERQYIIEMDDRLGTLVDQEGAVQPVSFIDDDNIASYYLSLGTSVNIVQNNSEIGENTGNEAITGPRGTTVRFKVAASTDLRTSTYLFEQLGSTSTVTTTSGDVDLYHIDTTVRITGATTGYRVDVPIRYVKKQ